MRILLLLLTLLPLMLHGQPAAKFAISGRVLLPGDRTQAGIPVRIVRTDKAGEPADFTEQDTAITAADGSFQTKTVPQGRYAICVSVDPAMGIIDPCEWQGSSKEVNAASGSNELIRLEAGTRLVFRMADADRKLRHPRELGGDRGAALIGVFDATGFFHMAKVTAVSREEQVWMLTVPKGRNYSTHVSVPGATLGGGKAQLADAIALEGKDLSLMEIKIAVEGKK